MFATAVSPSLGGAVAPPNGGELHLNVLPVRIGSEPGHVLSAQRVDERDRELRAASDHRRAYQIYSHLDRTYVWPLPDGEMPALPGDWRADAPADLPLEVVAFAAREAAISRLISDAGFEALGGRALDSVRLYRRRRNLAALPGLAADRRAAVFPLILVQSIVLGDGSDQASPGLILDVRTIQQIDASLAELEGVGVRIAGLRVHWFHSNGCTCPEPRHGLAGAIVGGNSDGELTLSRRATFVAPARCLRANANATLIAAFLGRLRGQPPERVERLLASAVQEEVSGARQWELLTSVRRTVSPLIILGGVSATLEPPARADGDAPWPRVLPPAPEPMLNFRYGAPLVAPGAGAGLRKHGPYDQSSRGRTADVTAVVLAGEAFQRAAQTLASALEHGIGTFRGMRETFKLTSFSVDTRIVAGVDAAAYQEAATALAQSQRHPDIVFPVVRWSDRYLPVGQDPYRAAKAILAGRDIASQAMTVELLSKPVASLQWSVSSACVSAYAKMGNVPWVLHDPVAGRELILGVGRALPERDDGGGREQLYGCTVVFRQDGDFLYAGSTAPVATTAEYEDMLAAQIRQALEMYETEQGGSAVDRLVVHVFKRTGRREVSAATRALAGRTAEAALLHVNRDAPLRILAVAADGSVATPSPGTVVALGPRDRLLVTGEPPKPGDAHPLRLTLDQASTYTDLDRLVAQAYGLVAMSWRGLKRGREPVSISYGHAVADKVGALRPYGFNPAGLGRRPWFL